MAIIGFGIAGLIVGLFFAIVYGVIFALTGGIARPNGTTISPVSAGVIYIAFCSAGGFAVGVLRALFRTRIGSALLGIVGTAPVIVGSGALYFGAWYRIDWLGAAVLSVLIGAPLGFVIRQEYDSFRQIGRQWKQPPDT